MNAMMLPAMLAGLVMSTGVVLTIGILTGRIAPRPHLSVPRRVKRLSRNLWRGPFRTPELRREHQRKLMAGAAAGAAVWIITGMPVYGFAAAALIPGLPWLLGAAKIEQAAIDRLAAIESWTRRLKDIVSRGTGLQQAIIASFETVPAEIHTELRDLVSRLQSGQDITTALHYFADDLDDKHADEVVLMLLGQVNSRGARLKQRLNHAADDAAEDVADRTENLSKRSGDQHTLKTLTYMILGFFALGILAPSYMEPYRSGTGQIILMGGIGALLALLLRARKANMPPRPERFLRRADDPAIIDGEWKETLDGQWRETPALELTA